MYRHMRMLIYRNGIALYSFITQILHIVFHEHFPSYEIFEVTVSFYKGKLAPTLDIYSVLTKKPGPWVYPLGTL